MTNYERIKNMSIEEMANEMAQQGCGECGIPPKFCRERKEDKCEQIALAWLNLKAEEKEETDYDVENDTSLSFSEQYDFCSF